VFALSRDGRLAVVAARNAVQLIDLERGEHLSGLLSAPIASDDSITKLALSPDAGTVLARTVRGRWLAWRFTATARSVSELQQLASLLDPSNADPPLDPQAHERVRRMLRASDIAATAASPVAAPRSFAAVAQAAPDPRFVPLDLAPAVNVPLNGGWPPRGSMGGDTPTLPPGPQRMHGIDWHVDGGVQLSWGGAAAALHPTQRSSALIPVPGVAADRVHVLMLVHIPANRSSAGSRAATVVLVDREGRERELEIRMLRDVVTRWQPELAEPSARIGWIGTSLTDLTDGQPTASATTSFVYAVSLDVPAGMPPVHGLRLETRDGPMEAPLFYAVTLERENAAGPGAAR
jgi:hypothetical protein